MDVEIIIIGFLFSFIAGISTGIGSLIAFFIRDFKHSHLSILMGFSAGVMIQISFMELLFSAVIEAGLLSANIAFFLGILVIAIIEFIIPHAYKEEKEELITDGEKRNKKLMRTGMLISLGIAIHNFPEGLLTLFGTIKDFNLGVMFLIAIALHNMPEGISVSAPIYYATNSKKKAFTWSILSGISEPCGAIVGFLFLYPFVSPFLLSMVLAFVAGIMVFITFDELLPICLGHGEAHKAISSLFLGMGMITLVALFLK